MKFVDAIPALPKQGEHIALPKSIPCLYLAGHEIVVQEASEKVIPQQEMSDTLLLEFKLYFIFAFRSLNYLQKERGNVIRIVEKVSLTIIYPSAHKNKIDLSRSGKFLIDILQGRIVR